MRANAGAAARRAQHRPLRPREQPAADRAAWLAALPKAELHLHLEGSIPLPALWTLIRKYGGDPDVPDLPALRKRQAYADFSAFLEAWIWKNGFLRDYEDFAFIAEAAALALRRRNIRYAELFFSPARFAPQGLETAPLAQAIRRGLDRASGVETWLIADVVRDLGPGVAQDTVAAVAECREFGVIGIGMGGAEHKVPPEPFAAVYEAARRHGLRTTVHAGEAAGAASVAAALDALAPDRIGHATRAEEDPALIDRLAESRLPLELCPLSNVATGAVPHLAAHPARRYWERGLNISINTDDPGMFHNSLAAEYAALMDCFGFSPEEIRSLVLQAVGASWRPGGAAALRERFVADAGWRLPGPANRQPASEQGRIAPC